jgi:hypothetical protein
MKLIFTARKEDGLKEVSERSVFSIITQRGRRSRSASIGAASTFAAIHILTRLWPLNEWTRKHVQECRIGYAAQTSRIMAPSS